LYVIGASALSPSAWIASGETTGAVVGANNPPTYAGESINVGNSGKYNPFCTPSSQSVSQNLQCATGFNNMASLNSGVILAAYFNANIMQLWPIPKAVDPGPFATTVGGNLAQSSATVVSCSQSNSVVGDTNSSCSAVIDGLANPSTNGAMCYKPAQPAGTPIYFQSPGTGGYINIDLGSVQAFQYVSVFGRADSPVSVMVYAGNSSDSAGANNVQLGAINCISGCQAAFTQQTFTISVGAQVPNPMGTQFAAAAPTNGTYPLFYARYVQVVGHGAALAICQVSVYKVAVPAPGNGIIYIQALPGNLVAVYGLVSSVYQTTIYNVTSNTHAAIQAASGVRLSAISSGSDGSVYISGTSAATGAVLLQVNLTNFAVTSTNLAGFQMPLASFAAF